MKVWLWRALRQQGDARLLGAAIVRTVSLGCLRGPFRFLRGLIGARDARPGAHRERVRRGSRFQGTKLAATSLAWVASDPARACSDFWCFTYLVEVLCIHFGYLKHSPLKQSHGARDISAKSMEDGDLQLA